MYTKDGINIFILLSQKNIQTHIDIRKSFTSHKMHIPINRH